LNVVKIVNGVNSNELKTIEIITFMDRWIRKEAENKERLNLVCLCGKCI